MKTANFKKSLRIVHEFRISNLQAILNLLLFSSSQNKKMLDYDALCKETSYWANGVEIKFKKV